MITESLIYQRARKGEKLDDLEIIDFHSHIGPWQNFYCPDSTASGMIRSMDLCGMSKVCINANAGISSDCHFGNLITLDAMEQFPDRVIGFVCVNPRYPDEMMKEIDYFCGEKGMKGIKVHPGFHSTSVADPVLTPVWEYAQENEMPVLIHTWDNQLCHPRLIEPLADKYPKVAFVMGHSGMPDFKTAAGIAKNHDNIYLELTAAGFVNGLIEYFVEKAGASKVIYGSDMGGWFSPIHGVGPVLYSKISDNEKMTILSFNAKRLLKI